VLQQALGQLLVAEVGLALGSEASRGVHVAHLSELQFLIHGPGTQGLTLEEDPSDLGSVFSRRLPRLCRGLKIGFSARLETAACNPPWAHG